MDLLFLALNNAQQLPLLSQQAGFKNTIDTAILNYILKFYWITRPNSNNDFKNNHNQSGRVELADATTCSRACELSLSARNTRRPQELRTQHLNWPLLSPFPAVSSLLPTHARGTRHAMPPPANLLFIFPPLLFLPPASI